MVTSGLIINLFLWIQICVVQSTYHGTVASEYYVSGTTYSPEGRISDANGMQVGTLDFHF